MKKFLIAACVLSLASAFKASAQQGFHAGLNTGYYYNLVLDKGLFDSPTYDHQRTWNSAPIGLSLGYHWEHGPGIMVEIIKANLGQNMDIRTIDPTRIGQQDNFIVSGKKRIDLDYIQVPVLFKLQTGESKVKFTFVAGPQISFLTEGRDTEEFSVAAVNYTGTNNAMIPVVPGREYVIGSTDAGARYEFNKMALGAVLGLGLDIYVHENIFISGLLRAGYNFNELRDEKGGGQKFIDTPQNTMIPTAPDTRLYQKELRTSGYAGFQLGVHYLFGQ